MRGSYSVQERNRLPPRLQIERVSQVEQQLKDWVFELLEVESPVQWMASSAASIPRNHLARKGPSGMLMEEIEGEYFDRLSVRRLGVPEPKLTRVGCAAALAEGSVAGRLFARSQWALVLVARWDGTAEPNGA
jgi:hypothetical protein